MKQTITYLIGLASGLVITVVLCLTDSMPIDCGCVTSSTYTTDVETPLTPDQGIVITEQEFLSFKDKFQHQPTDTNSSSGSVETGKGAWGGRIGKFAVERLLSNLGPAENFIDFRLGLSNDAVNPKTYLMFISKGEPGRAPEKLYIMNGGDEDSWCPMKCD